jgi:hypothetical protein
MEKNVLARQLSEVTDKLPHDELLEKCLTTELIETFTFGRVFYQLITARLTAFFSGDEPQLF